MPAPQDLSILENFPHLKGGQELRYLIHGFIDGESIN